MLNLVEVRTAQGALLALPMEDISGGYIIEEIEGLDPVKATLVSSSFAQLDGEYYQSSRRDTRNIKLKLSMEPDYAINTISSLRRHLYDFFMPKSQVNLRFYMTDQPYVEILGTIESCDGPLFTKDPEINVSVMCFDPDFFNPTEISVDGNTTADVDEILHFYPGTIETGVLFTLNVDRSISAFEIYHRGPDGITRSLEFSAPLLAGDILEISTVAGAKRVTRIRTGAQISVLYALSPQSNWMELLPGDNYIRFYAVGAEIPFTMKYTAKYGGL